MASQKNRGAAGAADSSALRDLPSVGALLELPEVRALSQAHGREPVVAATRRAVAAARERVRRGGDPRVGPEEIARALAEALVPRPRRVINATGVVLHTNLGRAPLPRLALERLVAAAEGYCDLELRLETGERGGRDHAVESHLQALTAAEAAFAVNNGAAAALLALASAAAGREVIVSRGELVEIGGGFRVPEVLAQSECRLVEVGTTNRTRLEDYARAVGPETGALLRVHRSNFALVGFTEEPTLAALAALATERGLPLLFDQGTGDLAEVRAAIDDGAGLVTFSGDKLLGGPQAGVLAGRRTLVEAARRHPLARALRVDKLTLAALGATLELWRAERWSELPARRMADEPDDAVRARAEEISQLLPVELDRSIVPSVARVGGGCRPLVALSSFAVRLASPRAGALAAALRRSDPPVVARVEGGAVLLDARTIAPDEVEAVARSVVEALARSAGVDGNDGADDGAAGEGDG